MSDDPTSLGPPVSYLVLAPGLPVYASDLRRVGTLVHVLAAPRQDIFEGLVLTLGEDAFRYADRDDVAEIRERGIVLAVDVTGAENLHRPSENPAVMRASPDDTSQSDLEQRLRRAWDYLSGNY